MSDVNVTVTQPPKITATVLDGDRVNVNVSAPAAIKVKTFTQGLPGPKGDDGEPGAPGDPGPPGPDQAFEHIQGVVSDTWVIVHGLDINPNVALVDTLDRAFDGEVTYDSPNQLTVHLAIAASGRALLS